MGQHTPAASVRAAVLKPCALSALHAARLLGGCGDADEATPGMAPARAFRWWRPNGKTCRCISTWSAARLGTQDVPIRARVEGFLETMNFQEGGFVEKGALLYTIDPQPFQAKLVEAQSQLAASQTTLAKAESDLRRIEPLAEMDAVSQQDLDSAVAQEAAARGRCAGRGSCRAAGRDRALLHTDISAPIAGRIGLTQARPGEFVGREPNPVVLNVLSDIDPDPGPLLHLGAGVHPAGPLTGWPTTAERSAERTRQPNPGPLQLILADGSVHPHPGRLAATAQAVDRRHRHLLLRGAVSQSRQRAGARSVRPGTGAA